MDKQSVIYPTPSQPPTPPTHRRCVGWKTAKPFPRVTSRLLVTLFQSLSIVEKRGYAIAYMSDDGGKAFGESALQIFSKCCAVSKTSKTSRRITPIESAS